MAQGKYNATAACKIALRAEGRFYYPDILVGERLIFHVSDGGQVEDVPTIAVSSSVLNLKRKLEAPLEVPVLSQELIFRIMPLMLLAAFAWRAFWRDNGGGIHSTGIWLFVHIYDTVGASSRVFVQAVGVRVFKATTQ